MIYKMLWTGVMEYKGETYKYNDHLSNYLFLGIDTREAVDTYQSQADAGQADAIFLVSMDRATEKIKVLFIPCLNSCGDCGSA